MNDNTFKTNLAADKPLLTIIEGRIYDLGKPVLREANGGRKWIERTLALNTSNEVGGVELAGIRFDDRRRGMLETPGLKAGLRVRVLARVKTREFQGSYYNDLQGLAVECLDSRGWRLVPERAAEERPEMSAVQAQQYALSQQTAPADEVGDDLPF